MCGIAGIYRFGGLNVSDRAAIVEMTGALTHRGPDEEGFFHGQRAALGCRRLAIIDIADGQQPMSSDDGRIVAVANAEIYNHNELRDDLKRQGRVFRTRCDVEVIPHLYAEKGESAAGEMNGQFAFAVHDTVSGKLVLGRDQTGIAPLFWTEIDGGIAFASEIKALLCMTEVRRQLDPAGLDQILTFPGLVSPRTMFAGIRSLPPGHVLVADAGQVRVRSYWDYDFPQSGSLPPMRDDEMLDELEAVLTDAVRRRLRADVPVGLYVSGGLDSALVATIAHSLEPDTVRDTFSVGFHRPDIDERRWQALVTDAIGSRHHEVVFDENDILSNLRDIVWFGETALKESYNACTLVLARLVNRSGLRVVLTGEGADELFGGYVGYRLDAARTDGGGFDLEAMLEDETRQRLWGDETFFYEREYNENASLTEALLAPDLAAERHRFSALASSPVDIGQLTGRSAFQKRSYLDLKLRLADHLLADHSDRVAYASHVEARYPFLDPGVVDFARRIPPELMLRGGEEKYPLKRLGERLVAPELAQRRKFSFVAQGSPALLRQRQDWVMDLLAPEVIRRQGVFNPDTVGRLREQYARQDFDLSQTYEDDHLMIVLTTGILIEMFGLSSPSFEN